MGQIKNIKLHIVTDIKAMIELGLDDGLFEELDGNKENGIDTICGNGESNEVSNTNKSQIECELYKPKQCTDEWFCGLSLVEDSSMEDCIESNMRQICYTIGIVINRLQTGTKN